MTIDNPRVRDFIRFAIDREAEAARYYADCGARASGAAQKRLFTDLAEIEQGHETRLREFLSSGNSAFFSRQAPRDLRISDFLVDREVTPGSAPQDVFLFAIKNEQKAFELYKRLADLEEDPDVRLLFNELANTEKEHKYLFETEYEKGAMAEN